MAVPNLKTKGIIQDLEVQEIRQETSAKKAKENNFRFFRYSQNKPSDEDFGETAGGQDKRISGIQLQTLAKCLIDFFGYDLTDITFDASLKDAGSINNNQYKSISAISNTIAQLQNGRGNIPNSENLKIQIIKRYRPIFASKKTNIQLGSSELELEDVAKEQVGVIGPVTYNFIIRQAIYQWFENTYLNDQTSYLNKTLPKLDSGWASQQIPTDLGYYIFVSPAGTPNQQPYPTIGVLLDITENLTDEAIIEKARQYIDFLLLRNTQKLVFDKIYKVIRSAPTQDKAPTRVCVYADLAEVLYSEQTQPILASIDMIKAGISSIHKYKKEFLSSDSFNTIQSIKNSIGIPSSKFFELEDKINSTVFEFQKPDQLQKNAELFSITNQTQKDYNEKYDLILSDLLSSHFNYTEEISDRISSERNLRKNILLRDYPSSPINERVQYYYDEEYNLLAASFIKNATTADQEAQLEDQTICITKENNSNLAIPEINPGISLLDELAQKGNTEYTKLNENTVLFITEFFIKQFFDQYSNISNGIKSNLPGEILPSVSDIFLENDYSKVKIDYLYSYDKNTLLDEAKDTKATLQFVKLKTSNNWTILFEIIDQLADKTFDDFINYHYPVLIHKPSEEKKPTTEPTATIPKDPSEPSKPPVKFETLKKTIVSVPNEVDFSSKLQIDGFLLEDCLGALVQLINNKTGGTPEEILNTVLDLLKYLDIEYFTNLILNKLYEELQNLSKGEGKENIVESIEQISDCIPPKKTAKINVIDQDTDIDDLLLPLFAFSLLNVPKIPYLFTADFLQILKRKIIEIVIQIILEFVTQFLNKIIQGIKKEFCNIDLTADSLGKSIPAGITPALNPPGFGSSPGDSLQGFTQKCSIEELLSSNPTISKNQIYNNVRNLYKLNISNSQYDTFFAGLTPILTSRNIIDMFSNNIDQQLFILLKNYSSDYPQFESLFFNKTTTSSFFNYLSQFIDLIPCYEQLALDNRYPPYCFDDVDPSLGLSEQQVLDKANALLDEIVSICEVLSGAGISDKLNNISFLDEAAKDAISSGGKAIISIAYNNFNQMKQAMDDSFETIDLLNNCVNNQTFALLEGAKTIDTEATDALITQIVQINKQGNIEFTKKGADYALTTIGFSYPNSVITSSWFAKGDVLKEEYITGITVGQTIFQLKYNDITNNNNEDIIKTSLDTKFIRKPGLFTGVKNKEKFLKVFFDASRFEPQLPSKDPVKAKDIKNYYYVYNNLINTSQTNLNKKIENLKKYNETEKRLQEFIINKTNNIYLEG